MHPSLRTGDIFFGIATAFLFGVFAANKGWDLVALGVAGMVCVVAVILCSARSRGWRKFAAFIFTAAVAGASYYYGYIGWRAAHTHLPAGKSAAFFGVVAEEPKAAGNFTMMALSLSRPYAGTLDIFTAPNSTEFHYGDELWIKGSVSVESDASEPAAMFMPQLHVISEHDGFWLKEMLIDLKAAIVQKIAQALPADQAALLTGILIGTTGTVNAAQKAQMEASGTSYIVNMYGYKIALITFALTAALTGRLPRRALLWITLATIALFVTASGGAISAVRAAVMGSFAVIARGTGRVFSARNAVTFAALGMVLLNATLLTDAAFQLSFLSFLGIYYLGPPIDHFFRWTDGGALQWKEHAMLSLATNLAILPIVMSTFGEFSLTSFVSNILIMIPWLAVIVLGALTAFFGFVAPALAFVAAQVVSVLLQYELFIIHIFAAMTIPMPVVFGSAFAVALYYGILIIFAHYYAAPPQENN
jgi:competence protein ComEC